MTPPPPDPPPESERELDHSGDDGGSPKPTLRARWEHIIFEADTPAGKAFDVVLLVLIGLSILVVMLESVESVRSRHVETLRFAEWIFTILFTIEYLMRIWTTPRPSRYIFSFFGVVDLLSIVPTYLGLFLAGDTQYLVVIRILRMLRMFRVLKMARHMREGDVILRALVASRAKITVFIFGVVSLIMIVGTFMYLIEGAEHGFTSIPVSIYWAVVTITTVGYGDISPETPAGQLLAACMMIVGYAIIAVPTGIVGIELARELGGSHSELRCPTCRRRHHRQDAVYCDRCGEALVED